MGLPDIISSLPDNLLDLFLVFLTTKELIRTTSTLSRRWRNVWKRVPKLDVNSSDFRTAQSFQNFVNGIMDYKLSRSNVEQIESFSLNWINFNDDFYGTIRIWVNQLVLMRPKQVSIQIDNLVDLSFLEPIFTCNSVRSLLLWPKAGEILFTVLDVPDLDLPHLEYVALGWLIIDNDIIQNFISRCPILKDLRIEHCFLMLNETITSSTIEKLIISHSVFDAQSGFVINMPNLEYLECQVHLGRFFGENLVSLNYARINLWDWLEGINANCVKLLEGLSNARTIQISGRYANLLLEMQAIASIPIFEKLQNLDLVSISVNENLDPIASFIRCTPNLENLSLQNVKIIKGVIRISPEIPCPKLKAIDIICLETDEQAHRLVKTIRSNFNKVKYITLRFDDDIDKLYDPEFLDQPNNR